MLDLNNLRIGDQIRQKESMDNYVIIGIDKTGSVRQSPCVILDWGSRKMREFLKVREIDLTKWERVT